MKRNKCFKSHPHVYYDKCLYCLSNKLINGCRGIQAQQSANPRLADKLSPTLHSLSFLLSCFHIFLTVLLCLWFLIELPRSDNSSGCYIILSNSAPSAGHYLTATTPGLPGGQQSMTSLASIRWVGGLGGPGAPGGKTCDGRV